MLRRIAIEDEGPIIAIGDVHGEHAMLEMLLADVEDLATDMGGARIVTLGDYVDRGRQSKRVIDRLLAGPRDPINEYLHLVGNHDLMMLQAYDDPTGLDMQRWIKAGGIQTLLSYGLVDEDELYDGAWRKRVPSEHLDFLRTLHHTVETPRFILVHAGLRPHVPLAEQTERDVTWIRDDFMFSDHDFGRMVVHGHTIASRPVMTETRMNVDTGAYSEGILTAVVLDSNIGFVQVLRDTERNLSSRQWDHTPRAVVEKSSGR